jgi:hypothetical protein
MNILILACMVYLISYFVAYKLRFRLEKTALVIIFTELIVMTVRIFQSEKLDIAQGIITICCDIVFKMALYYFVFEMGYVASKLESTNLEEYNKKKKRIMIVKAVIMIELSVIQIPLATIALIFSTVPEFKDYKQYTLPMFIIVRIAVLCDFFMFTYFGILLKYYIRKK